MPRKPRSKLGVARKLSISLSPEALQRLDAFCAQQDRERSWVLNRILTNGGQAGESWETMVLNWTAPSNTRQARRAS